MFLLSAPKKRLNLNVLNYQLETMLIGVGDRTENEAEGSIWTMSTTGCQWPGKISVFNCEL